MTLLWSEEFTSLDLASSLNPTGLWRPNDVWQDITKGYLDFGAGSASSWNCSPEQSLGGTKYNPFSVTNGILSITSQRTPSAASAAAGNAPWLTGILISNSNQVAFGYGYYEFRMALPKWCQGGFPALWFYAASGSLGNAAATNKGGAEIDLLEVFGYPTGQPWNLTLHSATNSNGPSAIGDQAIAETSSDTFGFHTYGMDWSATKLDFYRDNVLIGSGNSTFISWLAGLKMDIRLNVAMDASWFPTGQKSTSAGTGVTMSVDYIRQYDVKPSGVAPPVTPTTLVYVDSIGVVATSTATAPSTLLVDSIGQPILPPPPVAPSTPTGLSAVGGDAQALISWTPSGPADYYVISTVSADGDTFVDAYDDSYGGTVSTTASGDATSALLGGLLNGVSYSITVTAYAGGLASPPSDPVSVTPQLGADPIPDPSLPPPDPDAPEPIDPALLPVPPQQAPEVSAAMFRFPVPGLFQAPNVVRAPAAVAPTKVGHLQAVWFEKINERQPVGLDAFNPFGQDPLNPSDPSTSTNLVGQALYLLPSRGGLWITAFDHGYPVIQDVTSPWPDRDGELDYTDRYGSRNIVMNILAEPWRGVDANGVLQPSEAWADLVRAWSSLDNRLRLHFQLTGRHPVWCDVRTAQFQAPVALDDLGRFTIPITWGLYSADGSIYGDVLPGYAQDPARPGWYQLTVGTGQSGDTALNFLGGSTWAGGDGLNFRGGSTWANGDGLSFGGGASYGGPMVSVPQETIGSRRSQPIITISGGAVTGPVISLYGDDGDTERSRLQFSSSLVLTTNDVMVIDVANRRVVRNPDKFGNGEQLYRYLSGTVDWSNFFIDPNDSNAFAFGGAATSGAASAAISYRATYV